MTLTGIRPDFIRMSEVFRKLDSSKYLDHILVHSGQHYDKMLSDVFFDELEIRKPDFNLNIGASGREHFNQVNVLSIEIIDLLRFGKCPKPDIILFLGDSNSALASIPLRKEGYRIGHIEAGMRSYDMNMPEEINRICCDQMCDFLFAYHKNYEEKLIAENIPPNKIHVVGNTIVEVVNQFLPKMHLNPKKLDKILVDIHRPENIKSPQNLQNILDFANDCAVRFQLPIQMISFGRTRTAIENAELNMRWVKWVPLMSYQQYLQAQYDSVFMISDSGTAQEEPALLNTPVVVPRISTERPESVKYGCSKMLNVQTAWNGSWRDCLNWLDSMKTVNFIARTDWLGNGNTSERIVSILETLL